MDMQRSASDVIRGLLDAQCMTGGDAMRTTVVADRVKNLFLSLTLSVYVRHGVRDAACMRSAKEIVAPQPTTKCF